MTTIFFLQVVMLNEAYSRVEYRLEREGFDSVPALIRYYVGNRKPLSQVGFIEGLTTYPCIIRRRRSIPSYTEC